MNRGKPSKKDIDSIVEFGAEEKARAVSNDRDRWKRIASERNLDLVQCEAQIADLRRRLRVYDMVGAANIRPPTWRTRKVPKGDSRRGVLTLTLSDLHLDEVVDPAQVGGYNAFNRKIAELRLRRWAEKSCYIARSYIKGIEYDGACVMLMGDIFSGLIHEELRETNEAPIMQSFTFWLEKITAALTYIADEFKDVKIVGVVGNHGRLTRKPRAKFRAEENFDYLLYQMLAAQLKGDARFTWNIPTAADAVEKIYNTSYLVTHGDQFRGGGGWGGFFSPILRGHQKKTRRQAVLDQPFDCMVFGHWHQYHPGRTFIANGALKGFDEYAYTENFEAEPPIQALWVTTPEHGVTFAAPIFVGNRKAEGW